MSGDWSTTTEGYADLVVFGLPVRMSAAIGDHTVFSVRVGNLSFGEILRYLAGLARPGFRVELDPPWDVLDRITLEHLTLQLDITDRRIGFTYDDVGLDLTFLRLDRLGIWYQMAGDGKRGSVDVSLYGMFAGQDFTKEPIGWDVLSQRPPGVPSAGLKTFDLDYAGLGQHVTLQNRDDLTTLSSVIDALMASYGGVAQAGDPLASLPALRYDAGTNWIVGTQFSVLETVTLGVLFNDPVLYGLHLELRGERAKNLAGLEFDILYRKIADGLGVFHVELTVPSAMRQIELGAASLTLPVIVLDIFTNGNFKIDLGFPYGLDFTRSFTLQFFAGPVPVVGAGGFYLASLDSQTSTDVPHVTNGQFAPVIAFGIGLQLGVGKTFDKGILSAGILVAIEGALEGVLGFFRPDDPAGPPDTYYRVTGIVAVVGHVYGRVDFGIVSARVDFWARASAQITLEAYGATTVVLEATVSVVLDVKIVFLRVKFSFKATIRESVLLGQATHAPWIPDPGTDARLGRFPPAGHPLLTRRRPPQLAAQVGAARQRGLAWKARRVMAHLPTVSLFVQPIVTAGLKNDRPPGPPADTLVPQLCAALFVPVEREAGASDQEASFVDIARALLTWAIETLHDLPEGSELDPGDMHRAQLQAIYDNLTGGGREPLDVCTVIGFLRENFQFVVRPFPHGEPSRTEAAGKDWTVFPMLPFLTLTTSGDPPHTADFATTSPCGPEYRAAVAAYYARLEGEAAAMPGGQDGSPAAQPKPGTYSLASFLLADYLAIVLRHVVQDALDLFEHYTYQAADEDTLPGIAARFCPGLPDGEARILWANATSATFLNPGASLVIASQRTVVRPDETLSSLGQRLGLSRAGLAASIKDTAAVLTTGHLLAVPGAEYRLLWDDTLISLADRFSTSEAAIRRANPGFGWHLPGTPGRLPAGRSIRLPDVSYALQEGDSLETVSRRFGTAVDQILRANGTIPGLLAAGADVAIGLTVQLRAGETLKALASRLDIADAATLATALADHTGILAPGAAVTIDKGGCVIRWNDTLAEIAARYGIVDNPPGPILDANPGFDWTPPPGSGQALPLGRVINLPPLTHQVQAGDTLRRIAAHYGVALTDLIAAVVDDAHLLAAGAVAPAPAGRHTVQAQDEGSETLLAIAQRFGLTAFDLGSLNPATAFGTLLIPDCEILPLPDVMDRLDSRGAFRAPAPAVAQFLMNGLRVPDPTSWPPATGVDDDPASVPLYPMYTLTGQQWPAPTTPSNTYTVTLSLGEGDLGCRGGGPHITFEGVHPNSRIEIALAADEIALINNVGALVKAGTPLPPSLAATPLPPFAQAQMRFGLGKPVVWLTPEPIAFTTTPGPGGPQVYALPDALRRQLATSPARTPGLRLMADAGRTADRTPAIPVADAGWATRLEVTLRRVSDPGHADRPLPFVYEVFSADQDSRSLLLALLRYLWSAAGDETTLTLQYAPGRATGDAAGLRSDAVDRGRVRLMRANLSTDTRSPTLSRGGPAASPVTIASLLPADAVSFLELLWQASVTNSGGYYLHYRTAGSEPADLPDSLFDEEGAGKLSVLAIVRPQKHPGTIPIRAFHNCVVVAETLDSTRTSLFVEPAPVTVAKAGAATLEDIAKAQGIDVASMVEANATERHLIPPNTKITAGTKTYAAQVGDSLLTVAQALGESLSDLTAAVQKLPLRVGAAVWWHGAWMTRRATVPPGLAGFRVLRTDPVPATPKDHRANPTPTPPKPGLQDFELLFSRLGFSVRESAAFQASTAGLPVNPVRPDAGVEKAAPPWEYARILRVAPLAKTALGDAAGDPYAGLGTEATLAFEMLDVLGNRCPLPAASSTTQVPIRYTDPLRGPDQWPGVLIGYDLQRGSSGPQIVLRAAVDSGRYLAGPAEAFAPCAARARADLDSHRQVGWQLVQRDVTFEWGTSFSTSGTLDPAFLRDFLATVRAWIGTVATMSDLGHAVAPGDTLNGIAARYQVAASDLAAANADNHILREGTDLLVPHCLVTIPNDSLDTVVERAADPSVTVETVADRNRDLPLQPGITLRAGSLTYTTQPGDSLQTVSETHDVDIAALAAANANVPGLFPPAQPLLIRITPRPVVAGDTLAFIAAETGAALPDLAALNADDDVMAAGATLSVPLHVRLGDDRRATREVRPDETLGIIAQTEKISVAALARTNQNLCDLLTPGKTLSCRGHDEAIRDNDTLGTVLERFRRLDGLSGLSIAELAAVTQDAQVLRAGAVIVVSPAAAQVTPQLALQYPEDQPAFPFTVQITIIRNSHVDPAFTTVPGVASTVVRLQPLTDSDHDDRATGDGDRTLDLRAFARRVQEVLPGLRVATSDGTRTGEGAAATLMAVKFQEGAFSYSIDPTPFFFATPPLSTTLWTPAPGSAGAAARVTEGVDLDTWARRFLADMDRLLSPALAPAVVDLAPDEYSAIVGAKQQLATAISAGVRPVVTPQAGLAPDTDAARETLRQRLLDRLSDAGAADVLVQYRVSVNSPYADPALAPRLSGSVVGASCRLVEGDTLDRLAGAFHATLAAFAGIVAPVAGILRRGFQASWEAAVHTVAADDTLASVARALGCSVDTLAAHYHGDAGFLQTGADLGLARRTCEIRAGDTFDSVLVHLAPEAAGPASLAALVDRFLTLNGDTGGLLAAGAALTVETWIVDPGDSLATIATALALTATQLGTDNADTPDVLRPDATIEAGGATTTIAVGDTLRQVARKLNLELETLIDAVADRHDVLAVGAAMRRPAGIPGEVDGDESLVALAARLSVPPRQLVETQYLVPSLLRAGGGVGLLVRQPGFAASGAKVRLVVNDEQDKPRSSLTFAYDTAGHPLRSSVSQQLTYDIGELEFAIENIPQLTGYQASRWLRFVEPIVDRSIGQVTIPIPLRAHPTPPSMLAQGIRPCQPGTDEPREPLAWLRTYDYWFRYAYQRAAQDRLEARADCNVPDASQTAGRTAAEELPYALAEYLAVADELSASFATLPGLLVAPPGAATADRLREDLKQMAVLATAIAAAWERWDPPAPPVAERPASQVRVLDRASQRPSGRGRPATGGPRLVEVLPVRPARRLGRRLTDARLRAALPEVGADALYTHTLEGLDVLSAQNAWGFVRVTRNEDLLEGRPTDPRFVYRAERRPVVKAVPLLTRSVPVNIAAVTTPGVPLIDHLIGFFQPLLAPPASREIRRLGLSIGCGLPVTAGVDPHDANALLAVVPVALMPVADFDPDRDLDRSTGFCADLAATMTAWLEGTVPDASGAVWMFRINLYSTLAAANATQRLPLLALPDVRLALADVGTGRPGRTRRRAAGPKPARPSPQPAGRRQASSHRRAK